MLLLQYNMPKFDRIDLEVGISNRKLRYFFCNDQLSLQKSDDANDNKGQVLIAELANNAN